MEMGYDKSLEDEKSLDSLIEKLQRVQDDLSPEERDEFQAMIQLAVRAAAEISLEENRLQETGADFSRFAELAKPQSSHPIALGKKLDRLLR